MNSYGTLRWFTEIDEALYNVVTWCAAVHEKQFMVYKASVCKTPSIVHLLVQTYDVSNISFAEIGKVRFRSMEWITYSQKISKVTVVRWYNKVMHNSSHSILHQPQHKKFYTIFSAALGMWTTKCNKLVGHNPAKISIFNFLQIHINNSIKNICRSVCMCKNHKN